MGKFDKTLFVLKQGNDQLFVQIYVDDIIFECSSHVLLSQFSETMSKEFEMSMMGELTYFLGLQVKQTKEGTFVHQSKHTKDLLHRFGMENCKPIMIPMGTTSTLDPDEDGEPINQSEYRSMIGSHLYLTALRPDIQFAVCLCAHFQASPRVRPSLSGRTLMCNRIDPWISSRYAHLTECYHNQVNDILHDIRSLQYQILHKIIKQHQRKASRSQTSTSKTERRRP